MYVCLCVGVCTCVHVQLYARLYVCMLTRIKQEVYVYTHEYMYIHACAYFYAFASVLVCVCVCICGVNQRIHAYVVHEQSHQFIIPLRCRQCSFRSGSLAQGTCEVRI